MVEVECMQDMIPKSKFAKDCMLLHKEFQRGEMTTEELDMALASLTMANLKVFIPMHTPNKPEILLRFAEKRKTDEWRNKSIENKTRIEMKIYGSPNVKHYVLEKGRVEAKNHSDQEWLKTCERFYPDDQILRGILSDYEIIRQGVGYGA